MIFSEMLRKWSAKFNYHPNGIINFFDNLGYCCFSLNEGKLKKNQVTGLKHNRNQFLSFTQRKAHGTNKQILLISTTCIIFEEIQSQHNRIFQSLNQQDPLEMIFKFFMFYKVPLKIFK